MRPCNTRPTSFAAACRRPRGLRRYAGRRAAGPAEGDFLRTADLGRQLIDLVASPRCRLHLDVKAMSTEGQPVEQIIRRHAAVLQHFHANDANRRGPGMGDIDFLPILRALQDVDYQGWVSVEVFDYAPGVEALARNSITYLQTCLDRLSDPS